MSVKFTWAPDPTVAITSFAISVSTDKGVSFTSLATVPFNTASGAPNWDPQKKQFFYIDAGGAAGYVYQITATGANGTSIPEYVFAPPASLPMCLIIGALVDSFGNVDAGIPVIIRGFGTRGERWAHSPPGIVAQAPMALGVTGTSRTVYPDPNGYWQVELIQGTYARIEIPALDFVWVFEVPASPGPINIRDIQQLRGEALGLFPEMLGERNRYPEA